MKYNPQMLKLAREYRGLTQANLSEILGIGQGTISKVEKRLLSFDEDLATKVSSFLNFPLNFFSTEDTIIPIQGEHRRKLTASVKDYNSNQAKMTIVERHLIKLLDSVEIGDNEIPIWNVEEEGSPKLCAQAIRKLWKIPRGKIENISLLVEQYGGMIIPLDLKDMDGFSMYTNNGIPLIFVNKNLPPDRFRLTIAHELAHVIMHLSFNIDVSRDKEKEAFDFAAEFLTPETEIKPQLTKLNLQKLTDLKIYWKVSMQALLMRAKNLGTMSPHQLKYIWMQLSAEGYRKNEPQFFQTEKPLLLEQIINAYLEDLGYTNEEIASLLDLSLNDFNEIYLGKRTPYIIRTIK